MIMSIGDEETWYADADVLVKLARGFYSWAPFQTPDEIGILDELMNNAVLPPDPDWEDDHDRHDDSPESYWSIERMFEDL